MTSTRHKGLFIAAAVAVAASLHAQAGIDPSLYSGLRWRMIGPFRGGRVAAVSGVPGRPGEFYFGHVNGGVWKTINAGRTWTPIFDDQPVASIGALAVAPNQPDTVYVGTGESTLRDSTGYGNGVYKSVDAGRTWTHLGLDATQHIGRVAIDPRNADVVFVAAIGNLYAASPDRGVYKTTDGGKSWKKVLSRDDNTGAVDVVIDPANSSIVYASLWATRRAPWYTYAPSNSPGGGVYKSSDGGNTWRPLTGGLPTEAVGRIGIAVAPSNPRRIYAVVDAKDGGLFRSDDAGETWRRATGDQRVWGRGWYFEKVAIDPTNADIVFVPNVGVHKSKDGGATFSTFAVRGSPGGDDYHQLWISPTNPDVMIVASDQGAVVTLNGTADTPEWSSWYNQPTAQLYNVSITNSFPWIATGAQQDSGAVWVRSRSLTATISPRDWQGACAGGESGNTAADPLDPDLLFGGTVEKCRLSTNSPPANITPPPGPDRARADWTQPLVFSQADQHALYYGSQYLYKTVDGGTTWTRISEDLTRPEPGIPPTLDPTTAAMTDRNGRRGVIYSVAPSPVEKPLIWAGTDDGWIQLTTNDGSGWQNVTPSAMKSWDRVTAIEASHTDSNTAYAAVDRHQLSDFGPHVHRTRDLGKTWQEIVRGLPADGYVHAVKEDPVRAGLLFAGTERGVFVSFDAGDRWQSLQLNLPVTSMRDFEIHGNDLVVATHGRGFWVLDDMAVLRQLTAETSARDVVLFQPSEAIAVVQGGDNGTPWQKDEPQAENPPSGAVIDYYLRSAANGPVRIEILDSAGAVVRTYSSDAPSAPAETPQTVSALWRRPAPTVATAAGMHRWIWDLRDTPPAATGGPGGGGGRRPLPMRTGSFTVRLTANGQTQTAPLRVVPDPRTR
ncbi:MAG TPA: hypothetical protein VL263_11470 [Vicinamibacterales bacterium]|nr:hypothetical protein [Vicinamibacterales bacterium]